MACGGGVKKYQAGGDVITEKDLEAQAIKDALKNRDPGMTPALRRPYVNMDPGMTPKRQSDTVNVPGLGPMKRAPAQVRGDSLLLKKGGKTKRGNKK